MNSPSKTIVVDLVLGHFASCSGYTVEVSSWDSKISGIVNHASMDKAPAKFAWTNHETWLEHVY